MSETTWFVAEQLYDGSGAPARRDQAIGLSDGVITAVLPTAELPATERIHRLPGVVTPGFVDAHVHLLFTCDVDHERTRRRFETADDASLTAIGLRNATESLLGGVTTVRDCGDTRGIVRAVRTAVASGWALGPRILSAGAPLTTPRGHLNWCGNVVSSDEDIIASVNQLADDGCDLLKIMTSGGNMTVESDPLSAQFTDAQVALAAQLAHQRGMHVAAHAQNVASITGAVHGGVDTLEHCLWRNPDGSQADPDALVDLLQGSDSTVVVTLAGIQRALLPDAEGYGETELAAAAAISPTGSLAGDFAWARRVRQAGIPVVVASDAGVRFTPFRGFADTIACGQVALGCSLGEAIAASTSAAATAIGLGDRVGRVAPGYAADLVVLGDRGTDRLGPVQQVIQAGRTVARDGAVVLPRPPVAGSARDRGVPDVSLPPRRC